MARATAAESTDRVEHLQGMILAGSPKSFVLHMHDKYGGPLKRRATGF